MGHGGGFYIVEKRHIAPGQVPSPVYWFRVEAAVTWVTGFLMLVFVYYWTGGVELINPRGSAMSPQAAVALAVGLLVVCWIVYDRIWVSEAAEKNVALASALSLILLFAVGYLLCTVFNGRAAFIHLGAIMGTNMVANVWTRIIPAQIEAVAATKAGRERNPVLATRARRRAIHNTYLTLPVIFTMTATHAPSAYSNPLNWLILPLLVIVGFAARHLMILFDRRPRGSGPWLRAGAPLAVSLVALLFITAPRMMLATTESTVPFAVVRGIVDLRCQSCHSQAPTDRAFATAAAGLSFDSDEEIRLRARLIKLSAAVTRAMPPANKTGMTEEERELIGRWADHEGRDGASLLK